MGPLFYNNILFASHASKNPSLKIVNSHPRIRLKNQNFEPSKAVFNFPFNASTPVVEEWLAGEVMAFRTGGPANNPLPHGGQSKLTCTSSGPENIDAHLTGEIEKLLSQPAGWLIYNTHGLDDEGWGPLSASVLNRLLARLVAMPHVSVIPAGRVLVAAGS